MGEGELVLARSVMIDSVMPSEKYSSSGLPPKVWKGRTAMEAWTSRAAG